MMSARNMPRCTLLTVYHMPGWIGWEWRILLLIGLLAGTPSLGAQPSDPRVPEQGLGIAGHVWVAPDEAARVDLSHALLLFSHMETWSAQGNASQAAAPIWVSDVAGVKVTLRLGGMMLATGVQWIEPIPIQMDPRDTLGRPVINLAALGQQAMQTALGQLTRQVQTSTMTPTQVEESLRDLGSRLLVDVQIARRPRPVLIPSTDPDSSVVFSFVPGHHGLILTASRTRAADTRRATLWPASALADNLAPLAQIHQLLRGLDLPEGDLKIIGRPTPAGTGAAGAPTLHLARFEVLHVVRPSWNDPPMEMVRGQQLLPPMPVTSPTLESMAVRMTDFLLTRVRHDGQATGVYVPASDRWENETATWPETALLGFTLSQRLLLLHGSHAPEPELARLREALRRILAYLQPVDGSSGPAQRDPATASLFILTLHALQTESMAASWSPQIPGLAERVYQLRLPGGGFESQFMARNKPANLPLHGLILAALSTHAARTGRGDWHTTLRMELDQLWKTSDPGPLATAMPWLAVAEFALREKYENGAFKPLDEGRMQRIHALAKKLRSQMIRQAPSLGPADCIGGFDVTPRSPESAPYPDWRGSQFLAFWALALAQPEYRQGPDALPWLVDCGLASRYLGQLMYVETATFAVRQPGEVLGGVRLSLWDNRVGTPATAMSLLAITQLQRTLQTMQ